MEDGSHSPETSWALCLPVLCLISTRHLGSQLVGDARYPYLISYDMFHTVRQARYGSLCRELEDDRGHG